MTGELTPGAGHADAPFLDYALPEELIAQEPIESRDRSRLLVVDREGQSLQDRRFLDLPDLIDAGDLLVLNDTRVFPARLFARRSSGGRVELLLTERIGVRCWKALARPLGRLRPGERLSVEGDTGETGGETIEFVRRDGESGIVHIPNEGIIRERGEVPLPPYIYRKLSDPDRYQTVYAQQEGSAAAPTAGLHFTPELLQACRERGIAAAAVTLHVGVDTFRPIAAERIEDHQMHSEWFHVPAATSQSIRDTRTRGGRVVAVGTTVARVLETIGEGPVGGDEIEGRTRLFIRPPYEFKLVDSLITNFHLPRTTLLLMVGAFAGAGLLARAYAHAIGERYRFYSFGDAMLIV